MEVQDEVLDLLFDLTYKVTNFVRNNRHCKDGDICSYSSSSLWIISYMVWTVLKFSGVISTGEMSTSNSSLS